MKITVYGMEDMKPHFFIPSLVTISDMCKNILLDPLSYISIWRA